MEMKYLWVLTAGQNKQFEDIQIHKYHSFHYFCHFVQGQNNPTAPLRNVTRQQENTHYIH